MEESIETRVVRGAAVLDEKMPGWEHKIDLSTLDLASGCRCVLGQLFGERSMLEDQHPNGWWYAMTKLGFGTASQGFNVSVDGYASRAIRSAEYAQLDEAWISLIKTRFDTGAFSDG